MAIVPAMLPFSAGKPPTTPATTVTADAIPINPEIPDTEPELATDPNAKPV
jgi:hypothetical protein